MGGSLSEFTSFKLGLVGGSDLKLTAKRLGLIWRNVWNRTAASTRSSVSGLVGVEARRQAVPEMGCSCRLKGTFQTRSHNSIQPSQVQKKKNTLGNVVAKSGFKK